MSEGRDYITCPDELGNIHIADDVLAVIAAASALEVEGVSGLSTNLGSGIAELMGHRAHSKGVHLSVQDEKIAVDISILIKYGFSVPDVARKVQEAVMTAVSNTSGMTVDRVNVQVAGVSFPKEKRQ